MYHVLVPDDEVIPLAAVVRVAQSGDPQAVQEHRHFAGVRFDGAVQPPFDAYPSLVEGVGDLLLDLCAAEHVVYLDAAFTVTLLVLVRIGLQGVLDLLRLFGEPFVVGEQHVVLGDVELRNLSDLAVLSCKTAIELCDFAD